eukprot:2899401-Rhodomonas_salina.2
MKPIDVRKWGGVAVEVFAVRHKARRKGLRTQLIHPAPVVKLDGRTRSRKQKERPICPLFLITFSQSQYNGSQFCFAPFSALKEAGGQRKGMCY